MSTAEEESRNYKSPLPLPGDALYTYTPGVVTRLIGHFTRPEDDEEREYGTDWRASHMGIVGYNGETVESHIGQGVHHGDLAEILTWKPGKRVFFTRPANYTLDLGNRIVRQAEEYIGEKYDWHSIFALAIQNTIAGRAWTKRDGGAAANWLGDKMNARNRWFCSELSCEVYNQMPELEGLGVLGNKGVYLIHPQLALDDVAEQPREDTLFACRWEATLYGEPEEETIRKYYRTESKPKVKPVRDRRR